MSTRKNGLTITELARCAPEFARELEQLKSENMPEDWTWYGYNTMSNLPGLERLLLQAAPGLFGNIDKPILDIGAADGDLAFFLESKGFDVEIVDLPSTNWNSLRGAYELKRLLNSSVKIHEIDLDDAFQLPHESYDLVLFLGILYHLKNPFYVLEKLASASRRIVLTTRIARQTGRFGRRLEDLPVAYLLGPDECNNDPTNYWIFSRAGLERVLDRAGWNVVNMISFGDTKKSNPRDLDHDERAFVFAESRNFLSVD